MLFSRLLSFNGLPTTSWAWRDMHEGVAVSHGWSGACREGKRSWHAAQDRANIAWAAAAPLESFRRPSSY